MRFLLLWLCLASSAFAVTPEMLEHAIQFPVEKYTLPNGLTVLLHPDKTIPTVTVHTWYRVGSKDEQPGRTGLAHFFEHMMFKGTAKYPQAFWGQGLNSQGAQRNAFTSYDYTGYYITAPADRLPLLLDVESDRMRGLTLDPKDVTSEREVVKEERRMRYDDSIEGGIRERMASLLYEKLPYRWLPIGSMTDLNAASQEDLRAFYKQYYSPNNAVLVVAGAFDVDTTKKLIAQHYGPLPKENIVRPKITPETEQRAPRSATISREAQAPTVAISYRIPDNMHPDNYALDLVSIILGQGNSSRLYKTLVYKKELALGTYAGAASQMLGGEFLFYAGLKPGVDVAKVTKIIEDEVASLRKTPPSQQELDKARAIFMKDFVDGLKRVGGRARMLASYEITQGDYRRLFTDLKSYQAVTPKDITRVVKTYLGPKQRNTILVVPKK